MPSPQLRKKYWNGQLFLNIADLSLDTCISVTNSKDKITDVSCVTKYWIVTFRNTFNNRKNDLKFLLPPLGRRWWRGWNGWKMIEFRCDTEWNSSLLSITRNDLFTLQSFMVYWHCTGTRLGQVQGTGLGLVGPNILLRNVLTGPRQGKEPGPIVSRCACPVLCTCPDPVPVTTKNFV